MPTQISPSSPTTKSQPERDLEPLVIIGIIGVSSYLGYRYIYIPWSIKDKARKAALAVAKAGGSGLEDAAKLACMAGYAAVGVTPPASTIACNLTIEVLKKEWDLAKKTPKFLLQTADQFAQTTGGVVSTVTKPVLEAASGLIIGSVKAIANVASSIFGANDGGPASVGCAVYRAKYSPEEMYRTAQRCMFPNELEVQRKLQGDIFTGDCLTWRKQYQLWDLYKTARRCMTQHEIDIVETQIAHDKKALGK